MYLVKIFRTDIKCIILLYYQSRFICFYYLTYFTAHLRLQTFLEKTSLTVAIIISSTGIKSRNKNYIYILKGKSLWNAVIAEKKIQTAVHSVLNAVKISVRPSRAEVISQMNLTGHIIISARKPTYMNVFTGWTIQSTLLLQNIKSWELLLAHLFCSSPFLLS